MEKSKEADQKANPKKQIQDVERDSKEPLPKDNFQRSGDSDKDHRADPD